jgi:hypothetical protein
MKLQFTAPAEIDPVTGQPRRGEMHRERLQLRALDDSTLQPVPHKSTEAFNQPPNSYRREYLFVIRPLPETTELPLVTSWAAIGLQPATTHLVLPPTETIRKAIIPLA